MTMKKCTIIVEHMSSRVGTIDCVRGPNSRDILDCNQ
eukprot:GSA120T00013717001.1